MILQDMNQTFTQIMEFTKQNPIVASAFGLWGLSVVSYIAKGIPDRIISRIIYESRTSVTINNQDEIYYDMLNWITENKFHKYIRHLNFNNNIRSSGVYRRAGEPTISIGYGKIWFRHNGRIFFMTRQTEAGPTADAIVKESMVITVLGRNQAIFKELFDHIKKKPETSDDHLYTRIYIRKDKRWMYSCRQYKRPLSTVILDIKTEAKLLNTIDTFQKSKDWYIANGIPYRLGILLQGPPGTGKTSLIKALAAQYNRDLYIMTLGGQTDDSLLQSLCEVPENALIAIEDIDAQGVALMRDKANINKAFGLTMSGILNGLDGVASAENRIIVATTNNPENIDPAILRPGRIDLNLVIDVMNQNSFIRYMTRMYRDFVLPEDFSFTNRISMADLQKLVFENRTDYTKVLNVIAEKTEVKLKKAV